MTALVRSYNKRQGLIAIALFVVALLLMLASCSSGSNASGSPAQDTAPSQSGTSSPSPSKSSEKSAGSASVSAPSAPVTVIATASQQKPGKNAEQSSTSGGSNAGGDSQEKEPQRSKAPETPNADEPVRADIGLSNSSTCDKSDSGVLYIVKAQGWEDGPYTTHASYSTTLNGAYTTYDNIDAPDNSATNANPMDHWQWPCFNDPPGYYRLWFTKMGSNIPKSETVSFVVVA